MKSTFRSNLLTFFLLVIVICLITTLLPEEEEEPPPPLVSLKNSNPPIPWFIVIGTPKGGTTSLLRYLDYNPSVCVAFDPAFFNVYGKYVKGIDWYQQTFFSHCTYTKYIGEKTATYILQEQTSSRVRKELPNAKIIVLLRNPVDRLYSEWLNERCRYKLNQDFKTYFETNDRAVEFGKYAPQMKKWLEVFPKDQLLILKSEDFFQNPAETLNQAQDFIGVPRFEPSPKQLSIRYGAFCARFEKPVLEPSVRRQLEDFYRPHVRELEELLNRKFNWF